MNNNYVTLRGVGGWVRRNVTKRDRVGGWVKNGHFRRDVIMQWPLTSLTTLESAPKMLPVGINKQ